MMLYCPKCRRPYEEGTQRFCSADGARLLSAAPAKSGGQTSGVFTKLLGGTLSLEGNDGKRLPIQRSADAEQPRRASGQPPVVVRTFDVIEKPAVFRDAAEKPAANESEIIAAETPIPAVKPTPRMIKPGDVPASQARLGDRTVNPTGRLALTWANPAILLGQTVKGRYYVVEQLGEDETSIAYLAEDKLTEGKKVFVRVLMDERERDDASRRQIHEERVSLSHINHPNVALLIDSGELLEGKSFIVSEYVYGAPLTEMLSRREPFNRQRAARIIRQAASALSEVHQNGVLHRSLNPRSIILGVTEAGVEQVKIKDFAVFDGLDEPSEESIKYLSPEQLEGRQPNRASDVYSLAVVAYQMLTGRLPFDFSTAKELLKAQKHGLNSGSTNAPLDLPPQASEILEKALAYKPADRFPKAREFGDALFYSLTAPAATESKSPETAPPAKNIQTILPAAEMEILETRESAPLASTGKIGVEDEFEIAFEKTLPPENQEIAEPETLVDAAPPAENIKAAPGLAWEKRSPEPPPKNQPSRAFAIALGMLLFGVGAWAIWHYFSPPQDAPVFLKQNNTAVSGVNSGNQTDAANSPTENVNLSAQQPSQVAEPQTPIESPPPTRRIDAPSDSEYFQNSKENLKGDLAKNFRGFSFYYPKDWTKNTTSTNFADVARVGATGTPIEQMLVNYYESKGTFSADAAKFRQLVTQSENNLKKALDGKYTLISQGETKINGDWRAYEMKFKGEGKTKNGDVVTLWGRRLWIPASRPGIKSGFVLTLIATSLSPEVKSAADVGVKGELASILKTFEPTSLDTAY